jgi:hypothetical protein
MNKASLAPLRSVLPFVIVGFFVVLLLTFFVTNSAHADNRYKAVNNIKILAGTIAVSPMKLYDNEVIGGGSGINRQFTITNTSAGSSLSVTGISLSGDSAALFVLGSLPSFPVSLAPQEILQFTVAFNPGYTGLKTATVTITSDDADQPTITVPLRGLGTAGLGGSNEPSLQALLTLHEIPVTVGDDDASTNVINRNSAQQRAPILGEEVSMQKFIKAGDGPVTIEPLAVFGPTNNNPIVGMGWYKSGDNTTNTELFTVSNAPTSNGQTVNVNPTSTLSFDPGVSSFGFYSRWPAFGNRHLYSEDNLNTFDDAIPHHVRVYPYKTTAGTVVPFAYVVAFEEHIAGFDYQDLLFVVRNVTTASTLPIRDREPVSSSARYNSLKVYPNPLHQTFTIELSGQFQGAAKLQLLDAAGVISELGTTTVPVSGKKVDVDLSKQNVRPGIYFLRITTENNQTITRKLVVR